MTIRLHLSPFCKTFSTPAVSFINSLFNQ